MAFFSNVTHQKKSVFASQQRRAPPLGGVGGWGMGAIWGVGIKIVQCSIFPCSSFQLPFSLVSSVHVLLIVIVSHLFIFSMLFTPKNWLGPTLGPLGSPGPLDKKHYKNVCLDFVLVSRIPPIGQIPPIGFSFILVP